MNQNLTISWDTQINGSKQLSERAESYRILLERASAFKHMHCTACGKNEATISFKPDGLLVYPYVKEACCPEFEEALQKRLKSL